MAISRTPVFYSGASSTGRSAPDLSGGTAAGRLYDAHVAEFPPGTAYTFGTNATTPMPNGGGTATHLIAIDGATGALTSTAIALSAPIVMATNTGIFSGAGRIGVHNGTRAYVILMPSGAVADLGAM